MPSDKVKNTLLWIVAAFASVALVAALGLAYAGSKAGYWLEAPGRPPEKANAIVVLGGDGGERSRRAQALYHEGYAPIIVLTGLENGSAVPPPRLTWRADFLVAHGVPR